VRAHLIKMKLLKDIVYQFKVLFPKAPKHTKEEEKERERKLVSRFGWDESSLYRGKYLTSEEIEKRREALLGYSFL